MATEKEELLESVEKKAAEAVKNELKTFKESLPEYATPEDIEKKFKALSDKVDELGVKELKGDISLSTEVQIDAVNYKVTIK